MLVYCSRIAFVTTYSLISSRMISSSVWSTLMTSSMRRWISFAKRVLISGCVVIGLSSSEDLRPIIVLGIEHSHEAQASRAIEVAGVEKNSRDVHAPLELLQ